MPETQRHIPALITSAIFSVLIVVLSFVWQGRSGFNLWDEGFLWYGVQRVLAGESPLLDFMAYDPGRYYWSAALVGLFDDGGSLMGVRASVAVFQALGLFVGTLTIALSTPASQRGKLVFLLVACSTLAVWMFPRHKLFDISLSMLLLGTSAAMASTPSLRTYSMAGLVVGFVAVFGRNHGLYGALGSLCMMAWLRVGPDRRVAVVPGLLCWSAGVAAGFLPIAGMSMWIPGFGAAFVDSVLLLLEQKSTNLPLPVPWPWAVHVESLSWDQHVGALLTGWFFVGLLLYGATAIATVCIRRAKNCAVAPVHAACAFLALPYAHYAFSRADVGHLAHGIFPLLIGCFALLARARWSLRWPLSLALCGASFWVMHPFHPGWQCFASGRCVAVQISGDTIAMDGTVASDVQLLRELADRYAPNGQTFLAAPFWPGAYALLHRKAPVWEVYPLFPRTPTFERREIERIAAADLAFAVIFDMPLDGRDALRFRNTHPLTHQYIVDHFERLPYPDNPSYLIYRSRKPSP